jgi:hypothetical protein
MWFLNNGNAVTGVEIQAVVISLPRSYQWTGQRFKVSSSSKGSSGGGETTHLRICMPFPWSPEKDDGALSFDSSFDSSSDIRRRGAGAPMNKILGEHDNVTIIHKEACKVYRKALTLREDPQQKDIDTHLATDLPDKYSWDDWGFMTFDVEPNQWYEITYIHKISVTSTLTIPTILPIKLFYKGVTVAVEVHSINSETYNRQKFLAPQTVDPKVQSYIKSIGFTSINKYLTTEEFKGDEDIMIATCNWESSDDELGKSSDEDIDDDDSETT